MKEQPAADKLNRQPAKDKCKLGKQYQIDKSYIVVIDADIDY